MARLGSIAPPPDPSGSTLTNEQIAALMQNASAGLGPAQAYTTSSGGLIYSATPMSPDVATPGAPTNWTPALIIGGIAAFMLLYAAALRN